jgi:hypothetical protein
MKRIYAVTVLVGNDPEVDFEVRLVRAKNKSQAINYVARTNITAEVASQETLVTHVTAGYAIEDTDDKPVDLSEPEGTTDALPLPEAA